MIFCIDDKVDRCLARYSPTTATANQPTGHQMSQQGLYVSKKAYFGAKMAVFGPNILIILRGGKSSGTHISENHLGASFVLFFGRAWHQRDQKGQYLAQNDQKSQFLAKFGSVLTKILIYMGVSKTFSTLISGSLLDNCSV